MTDGLFIAEDLTLSLDFVTSRQAVLAKTRVGKSYTAQVQAEELLRLREQTLAFDPTGVWYGLRASADGNRAGYEIAVFGGDHGDVDLAPTSGAALAEAVVKERFSAIFDLSLFTPEQLATWVADFADVFYRLNREPVHLFADEADAYAAQTPESKAEHRSLASMDRIVRRGGVKGIGCTLISQRAALLNKNVLSQVEMVTVLRMTHPLDLASVMKWVNVHADPKTAAEMLAALPSLAKGQAWVWNPEAGLFKLIAIRRKYTFDSGKTPEAGKKAAPPKVLAKVDLVRLGEAVSEAVERSKQNDPKLLREENARLRARVTELETAPPPAPVIDKAKFSAALDSAFTAGHREACVLLTTPVEQLRADLITRCDAIVEKFRTAEWPLPLPSEHGLVAGDIVRGKMKDLPEFARFDIPETGPDYEIVATSPGKFKLVTPKATPSEGVDNEAQQRILDALAWLHAFGVKEPERSQVGALSKLDFEGGYFRRQIGRLKVEASIVVNGDGTISITPKGLQAAQKLSLPRTNAAFQGTVLSMLPEAQSKILNAAIDAYPGTVTREKIGRATGHDIEGGYFRRQIGRLKAMALIEVKGKGEIQARSILFPGGAR